MNPPTVAEFNAPGRTILYVRLGVGSAWAQAVLSTVPGRKNISKLCDVYVTPALRNRGYGRMVCRIAIQHAQECLLTPLYLYVEPYGKSKHKLSAEQLVKFYSSLGFRQIEHEATNPVMLYDLGHAGVSVRSSVRGLGTPPWGGVLPPLPDGMAGPGVLLAGREAVASRVQEADGQL